MFNRKAASQMQLFTFKLNKIKENYRFNSSVTVATTFKVLCRYKGLLAMVSECTHSIYPHYHANFCWAVLVSTTGFDFCDIYIPLKSHFSRKTFCDHSTKNNACPKALLSHCSAFPSSLFCGVGHDLELSNVLLSSHDF